MAPPATQSAEPRPPPLSGQIPTNLFPRRAPGGGAGWPLGAGPGGALGLDPCSATCHGSDPGPGARMVSCPIWAHRNN